MSALTPLAYGKQWIDKDDISAVVDALTSPFITQGPAIESFEKAMAEFCGARYAVALSSATAALHLGALALGLGPGDQLWTSPNTFVASANCGLYCGATVDFVDIDPQTYNMSVSALRLKLEAAAITGTLPKVLVPVDFAGQSCEMAQIHELSREYGFRIMEDASHAVGGEYLGARIGGGQYADLTVFSFHPVKIMTTGEGGLLLTNSFELYQKLLRLRSHGITRDPKNFRNVPHGSWYYEQVDLGFNYRITDLQAALGESQLHKVPLFLERRRELAARYTQLLAKLPLILPFQREDTRSSWHLYVVRPNPAQTAVTRAALVADLRKAQIFAQVHYIPVHMQPYYADKGFEVGDFPESEYYYSGALSLPMYYGLADHEQDRVVAALSASLNRS